MAGPADYTWVSFLLLFVVGAGCLDVGDPSGDSDLGGVGAEAVDFRWNPAEGETEFAYIAEVAAGPTTECTVIRAGMEGGFGHDSGMGRFFALIGPEIFLIFTARWGEALSVHADSISSYQQTSDIRGGRWWTSGHSGTFQNESRIYLEAAFDLQSKERKSVFSVACEGPSAHVRFYRALEVVPIHSPAAEGGVGANALLFSTPVEAGLNHGDRYSLTADADLTALLVSETPRKPGWPTDPILEGHLDLTTPQGNEMVRLEPSWNVTRFWRTTGTYEVGLDRVALGTTPLVGVLAGFSLEKELGSPQGLPASLLDWTNPWESVDE